MQYEIPEAPEISETPEIPDEINIPSRNHFIDFLVLVVGVFIFTAVSSFILGLSAGYFAKKIPFETELTFSEPFESEANLTTPEKDQYLRNLVAKIANCSDLPEGMRIKYHYQKGDMVNAFATLGGNIVIYQGLIDELDSENELAMIVAHEIAHIKNRHPIQSIGRVVVIGISFSLLMGNTVTNPLEHTGLLTLLNFSRSMEIEADKDGLAALNKCYGHIQGATEVFDKFEAFQQKKHMNPLPFLSTHPLNKDRISEIRNRAIKNKWPLIGLVKTIPDFVYKSKK
jgi:predicted Zn-dependent protease